jgi:hypothetical protein
MQAALAALPLPFLRGWLQSSRAQHTVQAASEDRAMPVELAWAEILNWTTPRAPLPWAALAARETAHPQGANGATRVTQDTDHEAAWAFVTLCHWQVGNGQFTLLDAGPVNEHESQALLASMRPYFEEDGITLLPFEPGRWLARSSLFDGLVSASLPRVLGLPVEPWFLGADQPELSPAVRTLRRLQNEMQMLLYQHPVNDARRTPINSIWFEGCGRLGGATPAPSPQTVPVVSIDDLRESWLLRDASAWARTWERLDAEVLPPLLTPAGARIAWCGQRQARWWVHEAPGAWQRLQRRVRPVKPVEVLACDA